MAIIKKDKEFENHPATKDPIRAVVVDVTPFKLKDTQWGQKKTCALVFETEMPRDDGKRWTHWEHGYTESIHEKSNLGRDAMKILGVTDLGAEFDTESLIGKPVKVIIEHTSKDGKTFANLTFLRKDDGPDPLKPSGDYTRKEAADKTSTGSSYQRADGAGSSDPAKDDTGWAKTKVHVGSNQGQELENLSAEKIEALIIHWIPKTEVAGYRKTADDTRLLNALSKYQEFQESLKKKDEEPTF